MYKVVFNLMSWLYYRKTYSCSLKYRVYLSVQVSSLGVRVRQTFIHSPSFNFWLRVLENRVLTKTFELGKDEVTGKWRRPHNEEAYALYSSQNIIRRWNQEE